jgi:hypothetical protein
MIPRAIVGSCPPLPYAGTMTPRLAYAVNWDSFGPDLLVGLATGLVVGIVLFFAERIAETRRNRDAAIFAWESLKPKLRSAAGIPWRRDQDTLTMPAALVKLDEIASREPLALWQSHFKQPEPAIEILSAMQRTRYSLEWLAEAIEAALETTTPEVTKHSSRSSTYVNRIVRVRGYGLADSHAISPFYPTTADTLARHSQATDELLRHPDVAVTMATYTEFVDIYNTSLKILKPLLLEDEQEAITTLNPLLDAEWVKKHWPKAPEPSRLSRLWRLLTPKRSAKQLPDAQPEPDPGHDPSQP